MKSMSLLRVVCFLIQPWSSADCPIHTKQYVVLLGGTAGCVVAARLVDADPALSVLIIESGPDNDSPTVSIPAMLITHLMPGSKTTAVYVAKNAPEVENRALAVTTGSVLGGGSSVNMMAYSRAQRCDWDSFGVPGWSAPEMLPFLKKASPQINCPLTVWVHVVNLTSGLEARDIPWRRS